MDYKLTKQFSKHSGRSAQKEKQALKNKQEKQLSAHFF
jgi:hypothetical protein